MRSIQPQPFSSVYGPVQSWRFGRSLGIDPIGLVSTCSFNCVYCQLGKIECQCSDRQIFVSTQHIQQNLQPFAPWDVDVITVSGSGEPTLALNLGTILTMLKTVANKPIGVLTNGSLLTDATVRSELAIADQVAVKVDAVVDNQFRRLNRSLTNCNLTQFWSGLQQFRQCYQGKLAIQTMMLSPWSDRDQAIYIALMYALQPDEIQLNTPTRPKPLNHQLEARGNHHPSALPYLARCLKPVSVDVLKTFADRIQATTSIPVHYPHLLYNELKDVQHDTHKTQSLSRTD
ncbi:radical SAM protein [Oculatella sp. LEGE 06141]|uniref:radical SAM protein n=1 Tax=Oculatella sp. LEGE 06141 TaxID=1828648 RepID=UPI00187E82A0|nr:radical SAM protein [Oculatella sp. LEGE 06141]MBE9181465.1 radical SAM protein [Oculatella sp. LEGE 06141]